VGAAVVGAAVGSCVGAASVAAAVGGASFFDSLLRLRAIFSMSSRARASSAIRSMSFSMFSCGVSSSAAECCSGAASSARANEANTNRYRKRILVATAYTRSDPVKIFFVE
jgi:hypothetical protein